LNRDPIDEVGSGVIAPRLFRTVEGHYDIEQPEEAPLQTYTFVENTPSEKSDALGLLCEMAIFFGHRGFPEGQQGAGIDWVRRTTWSPNIPLCDRFGAFTCGSRDVANAALDRWGAGWQMVPWPWLPTNVPLAVNPGVGHRNIVAEFRRAVPTLNREIPRLCAECCCERYSIWTVCDRWPQDPIGWKFLQKLKTAGLLPAGTACDKSIEYDCATFTDVSIGTAVP